MPRGVVMLVAALVALTAGCNDRVRINLPDEPTEVPTTVPTEIATEIPTNVPTGAGTFSLGDAEVRLSGAVEDTFELPISEQIPTTYVFGVVSSSWGEPGSNLLSINGTAGEGRNRTGPTLALVITLADGRSFASAANECVVRFDAAGDAGIEGDFECEGLSSTAGAVDATGTFEAS